MFSPICYVFLFLKNRFEINKVLSLFFPNLRNVNRLDFLQMWSPISPEQWTDTQYYLICFVNTVLSVFSNKNCLFFQYVLIVCFPFSLFFLLYLRGHRSLFSQLDSGQCHPTPLSWQTLIWKVLRVGLKWNRICRIWSRGEKGTQLLQTSTTRENKATLKVNVNYCKILPPWEKTQLI